jgi:hypothetical protein
MPVLIAGLKHFPKRMRMVIPAGLNAFQNGAFPERGFVTRTRFSNLKIEPRKPRQGSRGFVSFYSLATFQSLSLIAITTQLPRIPWHLKLDGHFQTPNPEAYPPP